MPHLSLGKHSAPSRLPARGKTLLIQAGRAGQLQVLQISRDINNSKASVFVLVHVSVCEQLLCLSSRLEHERLFTHVYGHTTQ